MADSDGDENKEAKSAEEEVATPAAEGTDDNPSSAPDAAAPDDDENDDDGDVSDSDNGSSSSSDEDEDDALPEIERRRRENIKRNEAVLAQLGLQSKDEGGVLGKKKSSSHRKRRRSTVDTDAVSAEPQRRSKRSTGAISYVEQPLRTLLADVDNPSKPKNPAPKKKEEGPKKPRAKRQPKESTRMARFVYDEFQAINSHKRRVFKEAEKNLRSAEFECRFWQKKALIEEKKEQKFLEVERLRKLVEEELRLYGSSSKDFLQQLDRRTAEISSKIRIYDVARATHEQKIEVEARRLENENKLKILEARVAYPRAIKESIRTLNSCLVERAPKDPPPPRRSKRVSEEDGAEPQPKKPKAGSRNEQSTDKDALSSSESAAISSATAQALLSQTVSDLAPKSKEDNQQTSENGKAKPKKDAKLNVGQWISPSFCATVDRSWLELDAASKHFELSGYVPQPGDTVLYYPAGHREFLNRFPDFLGKKLISRAPLWDRAEKEQRKSKKAAEGKENDKEHAAKSTTQTLKRWWNEDWLEGVEPTKGNLGHYPLLCRVEKCQAEFPPDPTKMVEDKSNNTWTETSIQPKGKGKSSRLRLAVTLRPLTPLIPPSWTETGPVDKKPLPAPNVTFTCVTFPCPSLSPFIVPFAWAFIRNHLLAVNDAVSVQSSKSERKAKIQSFASLDGDFGSFRLDDKVRFFADAMKAQGTSDMGSENDKSKSRAASTLPPQDVVVIGQFLAKLLNLSTVGQVADLTQNTDFFMLIRSTLPLWNAVSLQGSVYDRRTSWAHGWEMTTTGSKRNQNLARGSLKELLEFGLPVTLDNVLRLKMECTIEDYLRETPSTEWFRAQVTEDIAPCYGCAVPITMSFNRVLQRLKQKGNADEDSKCYYRSFEAISADINAIQDNCIIYNSTDSDVVQTAMVVVPQCKKLLSAVLAGHLREQREKLKAENEKRKFLASVMIADGSPDQEKEKTQNKPLDPFRFPFKGPLFRNWLQSSKPDVSWQSRAGSFAQWIPQTGDTVFYCRELHVKFVQAHYDSLVANQRVIPQVSDTASEGNERQDSQQSVESSEWKAGTIVSIRAEFPDKPPRNAEGCFKTESPILSVALRLSGVNETTLICWRPCMFLCKDEGVNDHGSGSCESCGVPFATSFLCPSWCDHFGHVLSDTCRGQLPGNPERRVRRPSGLGDDESDEIGRCLDLLKRRILENVKPDFLDPNLSTERVKHGYLPRAVKLGHKPIPTYDIANAAELTASSNNDKSLSTLSEVTFLPPWMVRESDGSGAKKSSIGALEASLSPCPKVSLELICLRLQNGLYRQREAIVGDIIEAYATSVLLLLAPAAKRKKNPISIKKVATVLSSRKYPGDGSSSKNSEKQPSKKASAKAASAPKENGQKDKSPKKSGTRIKIDLKDHKANNETRPSKNAEEKTAKGKMRKVLSEEETQLLERLERVRLVYATALVCASETIHVSHLYGLKSLVVSRQQLRQEMTTCSHQNVEAARARKVLITLLDAIKRDACDNRHPLLPLPRPKMKVKFLVAGKKVERDKPPVIALPPPPTVAAESTTQEESKPAATAPPPAAAAATIEQPQPPASSSAIVKVAAPEVPKSSGPANGTKAKPSKNEKPLSLARDSVTFDIGDFENDLPLSRVFFGRENRNGPCVRCSAAKKSMTFCRVIKGHSNADFDMAECFRGAGGLDGLLRTLLQEPPPFGSAAAQLSNNNTNVPKNVQQPETNEEIDAAEAAPSEIKSSAPSNGETATVSKETEPSSGSVTSGAAADKNEEENAKASASDAKKMDDSGTVVDSTLDKKTEEVVQDRHFNRTKYQEAQELQAEAIKILASAIQYKDAPARLSEAFMDENFPVDPSDGKFAFCVVCGLDGDLICCDTESCPNTVHVKCTTMDAIPEGDWYCDKCMASRVVVEGPNAEKVGDSMSSPQEAGGQAEEDAKKREAEKVAPSNSSAGEKASDSEAAAQPSKASPSIEPIKAPFVPTMPPVVTFDDAKARKLSAGLDQLFLTRTGHRRGGVKSEDANETNKAASQNKSDVQEDTKKEEEQPKKEEGESAREKEPEVASADVGPGILPLGTLFKKKFRYHGTFEGRVIQLPTDEHPFYRVRYEDDDEEDLTPNQLLRLLPKEKKQRGRPKKRPLEDTNNASKATSDAANKGAAAPPKKKRGRPLGWRKHLANDSGASKEVEIVQVKPPPTTKAASTNGENVTEAHEATPVESEENVPSEEPKEEIAREETGDKVSQEKEASQSEATTISLSLQMTNKNDKESTESPARNGRRRRKPDRFVDRFAI